MRISSHCMRDATCLPCNTDNASGDSTLQHRVQPRATDRLHCTSLFAGLSARTEVHFVWCRHLRCHHVNVRHRCTGLLEASRRCVRPHGAAQADCNSTSCDGARLGIPTPTLVIGGSATDVTEIRRAGRPEKVNSLGAPRPRAECAAACGLETTRPRDLHRARDPGCGQRRV